MAVHRKAVALMDPIEAVARLAAMAQARAESAQTRASGSASFDNADGTKTIIGPQAGSGEGAPSGQAIATHVGDTTPPPVPTGITAWSGDGSLHVMWDGTLSGDVPADFDHISILVDGEEVAQLSSAGSVTVGGVEAGATVSVTATAEDDACLADGTPAHNVSAPCAALKVEIRDAVAEVRADADAHGEQIDAVKQDIAAYKASAQATYATKTEVNEQTGAISKTLSADYTKTSDLGSTDAVKDAKAAGTTAQSQLSSYKNSNDAAVEDAKAAGTTAQSRLSTYKSSNDKAVADAKAAGTTAQSQLSTYKQSNDKAVADAKSAGTTAQSQLSAYKTSNDKAVAAAKKSGDDAAAALADYKGVVTETYAEKTELTEAVNQLSSTMSSNYTAFTDYRKTNDTALSKAQTDATNAQSTIDSYKQSNDKAVADAKAAGTTAQNQLSAYKGTNDQAVADAKKAGTDAQADLNSYKGTTNQRLDELKNIADNAIETFYLKGAPTASNPPASTWTTDTLKRQHAGDLYMDTDTGYSYRWSGTEWVQVKDSDVTKALKEIESVKTTYATKSELKATDTELSGKVSDALTTAKSYTDSSVEQEVTARNAAIKAQADSISLDVSRTYTKSETFSAYQTDADGRIATANANASTAVSTAKTAASDAATAKTQSSTAVSTANAASDNASKAVTTANAASSSASSAVSTANGASSTASQASADAAAAVETADSAKSSVDSLQVGGRNLALGTALKTSASEMRGNSATGDADLSHHVRWYNGSSSKHAFSRYSDAAWMDTVSVDANAGNVGIGFFREASETGLSAGDSYTLSWWAKTSAPGMKLWKGLAWLSSSGKWTWVGGQNPVASTGEWQHMTYTGTFPSDAVFILPSFGVVAGSSASVLYLRECKMEAGNRATGWSPAPEDTDSAVADAKKAGTDAQIRVQVSSAPADAAGDTSTLTATVWRGGQQLTEQEVAMIGLVAWYAGGSRVATGYTYSCAAGTAVECRLEA